MELKIKGIKSRIYILSGNNNDVEKFIKKHISDNDYHLIKIEIL